MHLRDCRQLAVDGYRRHFELHGDDLLPIGLLIARCAEWGIDAGTAMRALDGASPVSAGTTTPPDWQLVTGYDLDALAWVELPTRTEPQQAPTIAPIDLEELVPEEHRAELRALVADARAAVPLRDDNGALTGAWPLGLLRRAMLEAGRRIGLADPTLAVELTVDELVARLEGGDCTDSRGGIGTPRTTSRVVCVGRAAPARPRVRDSPAQCAPSGARPDGSRATGHGQPHAPCRRTRDRRRGNRRTRAGLSSSTTQPSRWGSSSPGTSSSLVSPARPGTRSSCTQVPWSPRPADSCRMPLSSPASSASPRCSAMSTACTRLRTGEMVTVDPIAGTATAA